MSAANSKRYFVAVGILSADGAQIAIRRRYFFGGRGAHHETHTLFLTTTVQFLMPSSTTHENGW